MCYTQKTGLKLLIPIIVLVLFLIVFAEDDKKVKKETLFQRYLPDGNLAIIEKEFGVKYLETPPPQVKVPDGFKLSGEYHTFKFLLKLTPKDIKDNPDKTKLLWFQENVYPKEFLGPSIPHGELHVHDVVIKEKSGYILLTFDGMVVVERFDPSAEQPDKYTAIFLFTESELFKKIVVKGGLFESDATVFCFLQFAEKDYFELWEIKNDKAKKVWQSDKSSDGQKK